MKTRTWCLVYLIGLLLVSKTSQTSTIKDQKTKRDTHKWDANIQLINFNHENKLKLIKAINLIKKIINSNQFRERIINYQYQGIKKFHENNELSNNEIYQKIMEGAETIGNTEKNGVMDVEIELYDQNSKTIGYTYPNSTRIWINLKYFNKYTPEQVADNLIHEWMHKLGFTHAVKWDKNREHSVPYAVGYIIEDIAKNF